MIIAEPDPLTQMKTHALAIFPDECCGFLFGTEQPDGTESLQKSGKWIMQNRVTKDDVLKSPGRIICKQNNLHWKADCCCWVFIIPIPNIRPFLPNMTG